MAFRSLHLSRRSVQNLSCRLSRFSFSSLSSNSWTQLLRNNSTSSVTARRPDRTSATDHETTRQGLQLRLNLQAEHLIDEHRRALDRILSAIQAISESSDSDISLLKSEISRLNDGFFMLVVAGEYNAGKSSLINALLGRNILEEGPTPTTEKVTKLKFSDHSIGETLREDVLVRGEPVSALASRLQIVDTPGTNAIDRHHEMLTRNFLPLCDLVLFVTSTDRPFSESERAFLQSIRTWGKKVILIVNKIDLLDTDEERRQVMQYVSDSAHSLLGGESRLFALSARLGKQAKASSANNAHATWQASGLAPLETFINETLDSIKRLRLKLQASTAVGRTLAEKYMSILQANHEVIRDDQKALEEINIFLKRHEQTITRAYPAYISRVDNVLRDVGERADTFFDRYLRTANIWNLSNKRNVEQLFNEEVTKGTYKSIQRQMHGITEWLADVSSRNLTDVTATFSRRLGERTKVLDVLYKNGNSDITKSALELDTLALGREMERCGSRERLVTALSDIGEDISNELSSWHDGKRMTDRIGTSVRLCNGLGISSLTCFLAHFMNEASLATNILSLDSTFMLLGGALGVSACTVIPRQRSLLRREMKSKLATVRRRMEDEVSTRVEQQLQMHLSAIESAVEPFQMLSKQQDKATKEHMRDLSFGIESLGELEEKVRQIEDTKADIES